jgi:SH3-like domain-containing protein
MRVTCTDSAWQASFMRFPVLVLIWLLALGSGLASAQTPPLQASKPPLSTPKQPDHKTAAGKTPVVPPHGPIHPHKPAVAAVPGNAAPVAPAIAPAPAEGTASPSDKLPDPEKPEGTTAKLPRFASLRSDDVNMRVGPGTKYPITWIYKRRDLPVEIEREFDVWRWVRDADGVQGWVHQATLMGRRGFIVQKADATLRSDASDTASAVAVLKPGVIGRIRSCEASSAWCNVQAGSYRGFLRRTQFWGVFPDEPVTP